MMSTMSFNRYNLFYRLERHLLLHKRGAADKDGPAAVPSGYETAKKLRALGLPPLPSRYQGVAVPGLWFLSSKGSDKKRSHRKSHGAASFTEIAQAVASNWKAIDEETKSFVTRVSNILKDHGEELGIVAPTPKKKKAGKAKARAKEKDNANSKKVGARAARSGVNPQLPSTTSIKKALSSQISNNSPVGVEEQTPFKIPPIAGISRQSTSSTEHSSPSPSKQEKEQFGASNNGNATSGHGPFRAFDDDFASCPERSFAGEGTNTATSPRLNLLATEESNGFQEQLRAFRLSFLQGAANGGVISSRGTGVGWPQPAMNPLATRESDGYQEESYGHQDEKLRWFDDATHQILQQQLRHGRQASFNMGGCDCQLGGQFGIKDVKIPDTRSTSFNIEGCDRPLSGEIENSIMKARQRLLLSIALSAASRKIVRRQRRQGRGGRRLSASLNVEDDGHPLAGAMGVGAGPGEHPTGPDSIGDTEVSERPAGFNSGSCCRLLAEATGVREEVAPARLAGFDAGSRSQKLAREPGVDDTEVARARLGSFILEGSNRELAVEIGDGDIYSVWSNGAR